MDLKELVKELDSAWKTDSKAVLDALPTGQGTLYHTAFSDGHKEGSSRVTREKEQVEAERDDLKSKLEATNEKVAQLEEEKPDVQRMNREWQEKFDTLKSTSETSITDLTAQLEQAEKNRALDEYERKLIAAHVDPAYARVKRVEAESDGRVTVEGKGKDIKYVVLEKGKKIPLQATGEKTPIDVLVEEVTPSIDPKFFTENVDLNGSNSQRGNRSGPSTKNEYEAARERKEAEQKAKHENRMNLREIAGRA